MIHAGHDITQSSHASIDLSLEHSQSIGHSLIGTMCFQRDGSF